MQQTFSRRVALAAACFVLVSTAGAYAAPPRKRPAGAAGAPGPAPLPKIAQIKTHTNFIAAAPTGNKLYACVYERMPGQTIGLKELGPSLRGGRDYAGWTVQPESGKTSQPVSISIQGGSVYFPSEAFLQNHVKVTDLATGKTEITVIDGANPYFIKRPGAVTPDGSLLLVPGNSVLSPFDLQTKQFRPSLDIAEPYGAMVPLDGDRFLISTYNNSGQPSLLIEWDWKTNALKASRTEYEIVVDGLKTNRGLIVAVARIGAGRYQVLQVLRQSEGSYRFKPLTKPFDSTTTPSVAVRGGNEPLLILGDCGTITSTLFTTTLRGGQGVRAVNLRTGKSYAASDTAGDLAVSADGTILYVQNLSLGITSYRLP